MLDIFTLQKILLRYCFQYFILQRGIVFSIFGIVNDATSHIVQQVVILLHPGRLEADLNIALSTYLNKSKSLGFNR